MERLEDLLWQQYLQDQVQSPILFFLMLCVFPGLKEP